MVQNIKSSMNDILGDASTGATDFGGGVHTDGGEEHGSTSIDFPLFGDLDSKSFWAAFVNSLLMILGKTLLNHFETYIFVCILF